MKNKGTWTFFLCRVSSGGSFYSEVLGALHTYTTAKNRTIGAESLTIHVRCKGKIALYAARIATVSPEMVAPEYMYDYEGVKTRSRIIRLPGPFLPVFSSIVKKMHKVANLRTRGYTVRCTRVVRSTVQRLVVGVKYDFLPILGSWDPYTMRTTCTNKTEYRTISKCLFLFVKFLVQFWLPSTLPERLLPQAK